MYTSKTQWVLNAGVATTTSRRGFVISIDEADLPVVDGLSIVAGHSGSRPYALVQRRRDNIIWRDGLGRFLTGASGKESVRHRDGNPLNNTRGNLYVNAKNGLEGVARTANGEVVLAAYRHGTILFDASDSAILAKYSLSVAKCIRGNKIYLLARAFPRGSSRGVTLSRLLTGATPDLVVDHINHDTLDNRRCNLRVCTSQQNRFNQVPVRNGYKGVASIPGKKPWSARIKKDGKTRCLGSFSTEADAARAYDTAASELFGDYAFLNFPPVQDQRSRGFPDSNQKTVDPTPTAPLSSEPCNP